MSAILYYFHDPMCGWCYAVQPALKILRQQLPNDVQWLSVLGGLAPDDDSAMDKEMQEYIQGHWRRIQQMVPGTELNFEFWEKCEARRSTYPACRAVIAAGLQGESYGDAMTAAIQRAYYREARNPSDRQTLVELAAELELDSEQFEMDLLSSAVQDELEAQVNFTQSVGVRGFPSLVLVYGKLAQLINIDYNDADAVVAEVREVNRRLREHDSGQQE